MADLRNAGDLSLRHASAQALTRYVQAARIEHAAEAEKNAVDSKSLQGLASVLNGVLMPQVKQGSADVNLAVRQASISSCRPQSFVEHPLSNSQVTS